MFYKFVVIHADATNTGAPDPVLHADMKERLYQHVYYLSETIGERYQKNPEAIKLAADYIKNAFQQSGLQTRTEKIDSEHNQNIIAEIKGADQPEQVLIVGAHYDSVWLSPGADDNASGVAALLEIARAVSNNRTGKTLRLIAFTNEEQPAAESHVMGSLVYARTSAEKKENIIGMISLEMLGYYDTSPYSQSYPLFAGLFYPHRADFIAFISNISSRPLLVNAIDLYARNATINAEGLVMHEKVLPDIRRSDHASFWDYNFPAIMITDTASFRNPNYHTVADTIETLNFDLMTEVVSALVPMVSALAD